MRQAKWRRDAAKLLDCPRIRLGQAEGGRGSATGRRPSLLCPGHAVQAGGIVGVLHRVLWQVAGGRWTADSVMDDSIEAGRSSDLGPDYHRAIQMDVDHVSAAIPR